MPRASKCGSKNRLTSADQLSDRLIPFRDIIVIGDGGYPATVEFSSGRMLTAFYAKRAADHEGYKMATVT